MAWSFRMLPMKAPYKSHWDVLELFQNVLWALVGPSWHDMCSCCQCSKQLLFICWSYSSYQSVSRAQCHWRSCVSSVKWSSRYQRTLSSAFSPCFWCRWRRRGPATAEASMICTGWSAKPTSVARIWLWPPRRLPSCIAKPTCHGKSASGSPLETESVRWAAALEWLTLT